MHAAINLQYRHAADVADVHAVALSYGESINQPVSSAVCETSSEAPVNNVLTDPESVYIIH